MASRLEAGAELGRGKYKLLRLLGEGSFGAVFEAENRTSGRHVAIKVLHPQWTEDREASGRLLQEAHASGRVRHRNVIDVYDVDQDGDTVYLMMEYLRGETLTKALERGNLPMHTIVSLLMQAMRGVAALHRHGVVHRDIKPENIFLAEEDDEPEPVPKILDFGISKLETQSPAARVSTSFGRIMGSPMYMSCEQLQNAKAVDHRTDVYACGVVLYEALTGRPPFDADTLTGLIGQVLYATPAPPRQLRPEIPDALERAILRAMAKPVVERTQSIDRLIHELEPFANERGFAPVMPLPPVLELRPAPAEPRPGIVSTPQPPKRKVRNAFLPRRPDTGRTAIVVGRTPRRLFGALFFAFMVLSVWALWERSAAERRAKDATAIIMAQTRGDPEKQAMLLREVRDKDTPGWSQAAWMAVTSAVPNRKLLGHENCVRAVAFSRDGKRVLTRADDNTARLWNTDGSGQPIVFPMQSELHSAVLSPDGKYVVTAADDKTARIWTVDGSAQPRILNGHQGAVLVAALSPDGRKIVTGSDDRTARLWNTSGAGEPTILRGHSGAIRALAYAQDGRRLATAGEDGSVRVWSSDGSSDPIVLTGHTEPVLALAFSPNGRRLVSASADRTLRVWSTDGADAPVVLRGHVGRVLVVAFSPDGKAIVSGSDDDTARVWNSDGTGEPEVFMHERRVTSVAYSPDGLRIATASNDRTVRIWQAGQLIHVLRGHTARVTSVAFSPDGRYLVSGSEDHSARIWKADGSGEPVALRGHGNTLWSVAFSPDARKVMSGGSDATARIWHADGTGQPVVLNALEPQVSAVAFSTDGKQALGLLSNASLRLWNTEHPAKSTTVRGEKADVYLAGFSLDRQRVITDAPNQAARVWNTDGSGKAIVLSGHEAPVSAVALSADGTLALTGSFDTTARVWDLGGKRPPIVLSGHQAAVSAVAFSLDGARVVTGSDDRTVRVWTLDGSVPPLVLVGHDDKVVAAAFAPNGKKVLTGSWDRTARLWNADGTGDALVLRGHEDFVTAVAFSQDGRKVVTGSRDRTARVWSIDVELLSDALWGLSPECLSASERVALLGENAKEAGVGVETCKGELAKRARERGPEIEAVGVTAARE